MSVHIRLPEQDDALAIKLDTPAGEAAEFVLPEWFANAPPAWTDAAEGRWYELDSASCRRRASKAASQSIPGERWEPSEWAEAIVNSWHEVAAALERYEKRTSRRPLISISY